MSEFLKEYMNSYGPTGFEYEIGSQKVWMKNIKKYSNKVEVDNYGTCYAEMGNEKSDFSVVIEAHCDEISYFVNYIDEKGYIKVIRNGGSDHQIAPSMRVILWSEEKGPINGIFGHPAIHIKDRAKEITLDTIFIDVGASSRDDVIKMGINIGTVVTLNAEMMELGENYYTGRSFDNRMGGFIISEVARKIKENNIKLPYKLYVVNSVQEEIGLKGAEMIAQRLKPNVAIVTDVCHETSSPAYNPVKHGHFIAGEGGVITTAPAVHNKLKRLVIETAKDNELKFQLSASSRATGTDTESFAYQNGGTPSVLISLPLKYMHTTVETVHKDDIQSVIDMIYQTLLKIEENHDFKY